MTLPLCSTPAIRERAPGSSEEKFGPFPKARDGESDHRGRSARFRQLQLPIRAVPFFDHQAGFQQAIQLLHKHPGREAEGI